MQTENQNQWLVGAKLGLMMGVIVPILLSLLGGEAPGAMLLLFGAWFITIPVLLAIMVKQGRSLRNQGEVTLENTTDWLRYGIAYLLIFVLVASINYSIVVLIGS